ncbi:MAG: GNAT family N-acetyltransferase [Hyphomicrobiaceae bacterium]
MQPIAPDGFMTVPPGKVATIVTSLEMMLAPNPAPVVSAPVGASLARCERPDLDWYRRLFRKVGEEWLWFSRLRLADEALAAIIHDPAVAVHALSVDGSEAGLLELDFRVPEECEIAFFGVIPSLIGKGVGGYLMREAITRAWAAPIRRMWVHTCTLDHPAALQFYRHLGFRAYAQQIEIADDPRVIGELPRTMGRHVPIF